MTALKACSIQASASRHTCQNIHKPPCRCCPLSCSLEYLKQECSQSKVFVLPAFETAPLSDTEEAHALARTAAAQNKEGLREMVQKEQLWQFALKLFKAVRSVVSCRAAVQTCSWAAEAGCKHNPVGCVGRCSRDMDCLGQCRCCLQQC